MSCQMSCAREFVLTVNVYNMLKMIFWDMLKGTCIGTLKYKCCHLQIKGSKLVINGKAMSSGQIQYFNVHNLSS